MGNQIDIMDFEAIIFDCDGTLVDTLPSHYLAWKEALRQTSFDTRLFTKDFYMENLAGKDNVQTISFLEETVNFLPPKYDIGNDKEKIFIKKYINETSPIKETLAIVKNLYGKRPLAVASSGLYEVVHKTLKINGLYQYFDHIVASEDVNGKVKPNPDLFLLAAKKLNVKPEKCHVFEDSESGMAAAKKAGMSVTRIDFNPTFKE